MVNASSSTDLGRRLCYRLIVGLQLSRVVNLKKRKLTATKRELSYRSHFEGEISINEFRINYYDRQTDDIMSHREKLTEKKTIHRKQYTLNAQ